MLHYGLNGPAGGRGPAQGWPIAVQGPEMSVDDFDLDAAWIRRAESDLAAFMEALAARLEGALPGRVKVERRRDGLLSKTSHVQRITLQGDKAIYEIVREKLGVSTTRTKAVRGVSISSTALPTPEWLAEVRAEVRRLADQIGGAAEGLRDFL